MPSQDNESSMDGDGIFLDREDKTKADNDANSPSRPASSAAAAPCPRWGHTMTMIDHRRFVVYGGQTIDKGTGEGGSFVADLHVHDLEDGSWTRPINCDGIARAWHTANFLPERRLLLCFGGEVLDGATGRLTATDQVMVLDTESGLCVYILFRFYRLSFFSLLFIRILGVRHSISILFPSRTVMLWYPPTGEFRTAYVLSHTTNNQSLYRSLCSTFALFRSIRPSLPPLPFVTQCRVKYRAAAAGMLAASCPIPTNWSSSAGLRAGGG